jgi:8-oxo-dGTP pyrophosphatase MutT (NUDIX family)
VRIEPGILARGPWPAEAVRVRWREDVFQPDPEHDAAADIAIAELADRGSPSHDGLAARLTDFSHENGLELELQPARWGLRLVEGGVRRSMTASCVVRDEAGRWLAGRRAGWVASWAGRWTLGAAGSVEVGENPAETLTRELEEEWGLVPQRAQVEALVCLSSGLISLIGQAWVSSEDEVVRDAEHDAHAWWPANPNDWPDEAETPLRMMATLLGS